MFEILNNNKLHPIQQLIVDPIMNTSETIDHGTLTQLIAAGAVHAAHIVGQPEGWALVVRYGLHERPLAALRSKRVRHFKKMDSLVQYLRKLGIVQFDVDAANYNPETAKATRPDRAAALKRAHEAAAYDQWFRAQVQASLDDPRPGTAHEEVEGRFAAKRAALRGRMANAQ